MRPRKGPHSVRMVSDSTDLLELNVRDGFKVEMDVGTSIRLTDESYCGVMLESMIVAKAVVGWMSAGLP